MFHSSAARNPAATATPCGHVAERSPAHGRWRGRCPCRPRRSPFRRASPHPAWPAGRRGRRDARRRRRGDRATRAIASIAAAATCSSARRPVSCLDGVDECVEARRRGHVRRHAHRQRRIEHDQRRQQLVAPRPRLAAGGIRQHGCPGRLRPRPRRRRHGHHRRPDRQAGGAQQVVLDARPTGGNGRGELRRVQRRAAADAHDERPIDRPDDLGGGVDRADGRLAAGMTCMTGVPDGPEQLDDRVDPPDDDLVGDDHGRVAAGTTGGATTSRWVVRHLTRAETRVRPSRVGEEPMDWKASIGSGATSDRCTSTSSSPMPGEDQPPQLHPPGHDHRAVDAVHRRRHLGVRRR